MAVDMFLKLDDIAGDSADDVAAKPSGKSHAGEMDVLAWSWGMSQSASTHSGAGGGAGKANVQDLSLTKRIDKASPNLIKFCCTGKHFASAILTVRKAGDKPIEYLIVKMKDVIISSLSTGGSGGGDVLTENMSLNFSSFEVMYTEQDEKGAPKASITGAFDIKGNTAK